MKKAVILFAALFFGLQTICSQQLNLKHVMVAEGALVSAGFFALNQMWYSNYDKVPFHFFNDNKEWLQQDKLGHAFTAFHLQKNQLQVFKQGGMENKKAMLWSVLSVSVAMSSIEVLDGFSSKWGASVGDVLANSCGITLAALSAKLQHQIGFKYSFHPSKYAAYRPEILGTGVSTLIKDYNAQRYWLTISPKANKYPVTFCVGHGVSGLTGGEINAVANNKNELIPLFERNRMWLLSIDINRHYFNTNNKWMKRFLWLSDLIKIPAPAVYFEGSKLRASWFFY